LVDENRVVKAGKQLVVPRSKEEVAALEEIVRRAVGFNVERGDSLTLKSMPFHQDELGDVAKISEFAAYKRYIPYGALALVVIVALIVLALRSKADKQLAATQKALELKAAQTAGALPPGMELPIAALPEAPAVDYRAQALALASKDPATASLVLKGWLAQAPSTPVAAP
jgi:flagellar M-ring protein FliF